VRARCGAIRSRAARIALVVGISRDRARAPQAEPGAEQRELGERVLPRLRVAQAGDLGLQLRDLAPLEHLGRHEAGVFQDAVRDPDLRRHERVVVERERPAGAGQVVEIAAPERLLDALLHQGVGREKGRVAGHRPRA
jgi:hypothetical protein